MNLEVNIVVSITSFLLLYATVTVEYDRKSTDFISSQSSPTENPAEKIIEQIISCSFF